MADAAVGAVITAAKMVHEAVQTMRANQQRGKKLGERVTLIVESVQPRMRSLGGSTAKAADRLLHLLGEIRYFLAQFGSQGLLKGLLFASGQNDRFTELHTELGQICQDFQLALQVDAHADRKAAEEDQRILKDVLERAAKNPKVIEEEFQISMDQAESAAEAIEARREDIRRALGDGAVKQLQMIRSNLISMSSMSTRAVESVDTIPPWDVSYDPLVDKLGAGGFGVVYRGRWRDTTSVAIKTLHSATKETRREMAAEAKVWTGLRHDNIIPLFGWCMTAEHPFLVCPLMTGGDLAGYVRDHHDDFGLGNRVALLWDVSKGVHYLHGCAPPIIHRDLKALNCLVDASNGRVMVSDFGFAKAKEAGAKAEDGGTVRWMAPELLDKSGQASEASDAYAFGMIIFEVFSGGLVPFDNITRTADVKQAVLADTRPELPNTVPAPLVESVKLLWKKELKERPNMRSMAQSLEKLQKEHVGTTVPASQLVSKSGVDSGLGGVRSSRSGVVSGLHSQSQNRSSIAPAEFKELGKAEQKQLQQFEKALKAKGATVASLAPLVPQGCAVVCKVHGASSATTGPVVGSLSAAVAAAQQSARTTILVMAGEYRENVVVTQSLRILARGECVLVSPGTRAAMTLDGCDEQTRIVGLTVRGGEASAGVECHHFLGTLEKCSVTCASEGDGRCALLIDGGMPKLRSCEIHSAGHDGMIVQGEAQVVLDSCCIRGAKQTGVVVRGSAHVQLEDCQIVKNAGVGFLASGNSDSKFVRCECASNGRSGLRAVGDVSVRVEDSKVFKNGLHGAEASQKASVTILRSALTENEGSAVCGWMSSTWKLGGCKISKNKACGAALTHKSSLTLSDKCEITKCGGWAVIAHGNDVSLAASECVVKGNGTDNVGTHGNPRVEFPVKKGSIVKSADKDAAAHACRPSSDEEARIRFEVEEQTLRENAEKEAAARKTAEETAARNIAEESARREREAREAEVRKANEDQQRAKQLEALRAEAEQLRRDREKAEIDRQLAAESERLRLEKEQLQRMQAEADAARRAREEVARAQEEEAHRVAAEVAARKAEADKAAAEEAARKAAEDKAVREKEAAEEAARKAAADKAAKEKEAAEEAARRLAQGVVVTKSGKVPDELRDMFVVSNVCEGVRVAAIGTTVHLLPGDYRESVVLDKDVTLVGFGYTPTDGIGVEASALKVRIIGSDAGPALTLKSEATVRGLRLENPSVKVHAVDVKGANGWVMEGCMVSGKSKPDREEAGGIVSSGGSGTIRSCSVVECSWNGVVAKGGSDLTIERCKFALNKMHGVLARDKCNVRMVECVLEGNEWTGMCSHDESDAILERCKFLRNGWYGVDVTLKSTARLVECECIENEKHGLAIEKSKAVVQRCKMVRNKQSGARAGEKSTLRMAECECIENAMDGLNVTESDAVAERCKMTRNKQNGVHVWDKANGQFVELECVENGSDGIGVSTGSHCTAERCRLLNNGRYGAVRFLSPPPSTFTLKDCTFSGNTKGDRDDC
jgi:serine/threonine protein kinase